MDFKLWLEAEEIHPLEGWHKEFVDAKRQEKDYHGSYHYNRHRGLPQKPLPKVGTKDLLRDPRAQSLELVEVINLDGDTQGMHGFGDQEDVAAGDPAPGAIWKILIDANTEGKLKGMPAVIIDRSWGSFHERALRISAYVVVNDLVAANPNRRDLEYETLNAKDLGKIAKVFRFESLQLTAEVLEQIEPNLSLPVNPGESREEYWSRAIRSAGPTRQPDPTGYDDSDDYYKS